MLTITPHRSLIFVHGLTGNRDTTWVHRHTSFFWPRSITEDIRSACVTTFGYAVNPSIFCGTQHSALILDSARHLLESLLHHREAHKDLPIIFLAHGLGGHICEQALLLCQESLELEKLRSSVHAIIFFDTPHSGDLLATPILALNKYFGGLDIPAKQSILDSLPARSDLFPRLEFEFRELLRHTQYRIKTADWVGVSSSDKQITPLSNELTLANSYAHLNHADVAKFYGRDDEGYQFVLSRIRKWMYEML
jgi:pimeloyl-ACP methyl ester carboxylesterase